MDNLSASKCPIDIEWELLTEIDDSNLKIKALNAFVQKYVKDCSDEAKQYIEKASELFEFLAEEIVIYEDWVNAMYENTIDAYKNFISQHSNSSYQREAEIALRTLKIDLLKDMKDNPCKYFREDIYHFIDSGIFSYDELVVENHLLTEEAYNQILRYPTFRSQEGLPPFPLCNPISRTGNVDILFLGVPGSGGKTSLMASLMSLINNEDFVLNENDGAALYAKYLSDCMNSNFLPSRTGYSDIYVVDTDLYDGHANQGVSIIEFAGEKFRDMAFVEDSFASEDLGPTLSSILKNDNPKILFWAIDPTYHEYIVLDDGTTDYNIDQAEMFKRVSELLYKDNSFCKKIIGIHVVVTKSDKWGRRYPLNEPPVNVFGYREGIAMLNTICHDHKIMDYHNNTVDIIPFSIGKFMIGGTYKFDNKDAKRILEVIRNDISNYRKTNRIITSMTSKQIDAIRSGKVSLLQLLEMCLNGDSMITIENLRAIGYPKIEQLEELYYREMLNPSGSGQFQSIEAEWKMLKSLPFDSRKETLIQEFIQKLYLENTKYARSFRKKAEAYWEELMEGSRTKGIIREYNEELDARNES